MSTALAEAAQLKADIRLAQAVSEFALILNDTQRGMFKTLRTRSPPTCQDIIRLTEEINKDGSRLHRSWRPIGTRLVGILDRVQMLAVSGDLVIGGSQNLVASGVWAVVRLSLDTALRFLSYFEKVSQLLMRLGATSKIHRDVISLYPDSRELQDLRCEYLIATVALCHKIVVFSRKSLLSQFASSVGASFEAACGKLSKDVEYWGTMIEKKAGQLSMQQQQESDSTLLSYVGLGSLMSTPHTRRPYLIRRARLLQLLSPNEPTFGRNWKRERKRGSVKWIFEHDNYARWSSGDASLPLWIRGNLGSGKTVTLANMIGELSSTASAESHCVVSFFCQSGSPQSVESRWIMGSLAHQILQDQQDNRSRSISSGDLDKYFADPNGLSPLDITDLILGVLPTSRLCFLVVDALDECSDAEVDITMNCLRLLITRRQVRLCWSSRNEPRIASLVSAYIPITSYISMASMEKNAEMMEYIEVEIERRKGMRCINEQMETTLKERLCTGSQGMYLWVTLQLEAIFPKYSHRVLSDADILNMLEVLPRTLPEAYEQALGRISDSTYSSKIFKLVAAAFRPLHVDELRVALNVEAGSLAWNSATFPRTDSHELVGLCGGTLLEVDEETNCVYFIHHSAALHLLSEPDESKSTADLHFTVRDADLAMGAVCVTYLNYDEFDRRITFQTRNDLVIKRLEEEINSSLMFNASFITRILLFLRPRFRMPSHPVGVDISRTLRSLAPDQTKQDVQQFVGYAQRNCIYHARFFLPEKPSKQLYSLWLRLIHTVPERLHLPWETDAGMPAMEWALRTGHGGVLWGLLDTGSERDLMKELCESLERSVDHFALDPEHLGNILARYIHYASSTDVNPLPVIRFLLQKGADPRPTFRGLTSLEHAVAFSRLRKDSYVYIHVLKQLVMAGCDPNSDRFETNVLMFTIELGLPLEVELLLKYGADPNREVDGRSPLGLAISRSDENISRILLSAGARVTSTFDRRPAIQLAIERGQTPIIPQLISRGARLDFRTDDTGASAFSLAVQSGQGWTASYVLSRLPPFVNTPPRQLIWRLDVGHLCKDSDEDPEDTIPSLSSSQRSELEDYIIDEHDFELWQDGNVAVVDSTEDDSSEGHRSDDPKPLSLPSRGKFPDNFGESLANGADANAECDAGFSAFAHAIMLGDTEAAGLLLRYGADINRRMPDGHTPLTLAITRCDTAMAKLLVAHGADPDLAGPLEETPLEAARNLILRSDVSSLECNKILQLMLETVKPESGGELWLRFILYAVREGILQEKTLEVFITSGGSVAESLRNDTRPQHHLFALAAQRSWLGAMRLMRPRCDAWCLDVALYHVLFNHDCQRTASAAGRCDHSLRAIRLLLEWNAKLLGKGQFAKQAIHEALHHGRDKVAALLLTYGMPSKAEKRADIQSLESLAVNNDCLQSAVILRNAAGPFSEEQSTGAPARARHEGSNSCLITHNSIEEIGGIREMEKDAGKAGGMVQHQSTANLLVSFP